MYHRFVEYISRVLYISLVFFVLGLYNTPLDSQETILLLQEGEDTYLSGDYKKSLTLWLKALKSNPNSTKALLGHAKTSLKLNSIRDAESSYNKALKLSPENTEAIAGIGIVLSQQGKNLEARKYLEENLRRFPNDNNLLLALSSVYEDMDKTELAIYKLETAKKSRSFDVMLLDQLGRLYIKQNKLSQAQSLATEIDSLYPNSFLGDRMNGIVNSILAFRQPSSTNESKSYYQSAKKSFDSSLLTNPKDEETLYWLGKLYVWRGEEESRRLGLEIFQDLANQYPQKERYLHLSAALLTERTSLSATEKKLVEDYYNRLLLKNDLDEITRFQAEEYSLRFLPQESPFRKKLGIYRLERYNAERNSLHYQSSLYHLYRARDLIPNQQTTRDGLIDAYKNTGSLNEFIQLLSTITQDDPSNFKAQNRLEQAVLLSKKTLEYQEGFLQPMGNGMKFRETTTLPKIYLMDFHPDEDMGDKILAPYIVKNAVLHSLKNTPGVHLASDKESELIQRSIRSQNLSSFNPYHNSTHFDISETPGYPESVRFIGIGRFKDHGRSIQIEFQVYDRKTGKFSDSIKLHSKGRSSLAFIASNMSQKIKSIIPKEGNIIKIAKDGVVINLGLRNDITKDSVIQFKRGSKTYMTGTIQKLGDTISLVKPSNLYWESELATGDLVTVDGK